MAPRYKRVIVPLDDTATEALAELSLWLGLGEDALAKRLLSGTLHVIAGALESRQESSEAPESESEESVVPAGWFQVHDASQLSERQRLNMRKGGIGWIAPDDPREVRNFQEDIVWPKSQ